MAGALAYILYLLTSTASKLQRRHIAIRRDNDEGQVDFAFRVMLITFILSPILIFFKKPELSQSINAIIMLGLVCGIFGAIAISAQYIAQRHVEAGVTSLLGNSYAPLIIVLATIFLDEKLQLRQILGTALLLVSVVMVSQKHRLSKWRFDQYFWLNIVAGITMAFMLTAERALIKYNGLASGTMISWGAQVLFLGLAALVVGARSQYNASDTAITGGIRFSQQLSWVIFVTAVANLSVASVLATFSTIVVFIAGAIFLHEREDLRRKIIGSLIATAGLILMV